MLYDFLKSRPLTIFSILLAAPLFVLQTWTQKVPALLYILFSLPLMLNLVFCLVDHWQQKPRNLKGWGFWVSHFALLMIFVGALLSYVTRTEGYVSLVEGQSFVDAPTNYTHWRDQLFHRPASGLRTALQKVYVEHWPDGSLKEFSGDIEVATAQGKEFSSTLGVNRPFYHEKLVVSLTRNYGLAVLLRYSTRAGTEQGSVLVPFEGKAAFSVPGSRLKGTLEVRDFGAEELFLTLEHGAENVSPRVVVEGETLALRDALFRLQRVERWAEVCVTYDPWHYLVYAGFALFLGGTLVFYWFKLGGSDE